MHKHEIQWLALTTVEDLLSHNPGHGDADIWDGVFVQSEEVRQQLRGKALTAQSLFLQDVLTQVGIPATGTPSLKCVLR